MRYAFGRCRLDTASRELVRDGDAVHLSPKAFELLRLLIDARPSVLTKAQLMSRLWPDAFVVEANLPVIVGEVRNALGESGAAASSIRTHHGVGYSFVPDVRETRSNGDMAPADGPLALLRIGSRTILLGTGANTVGRDPDCDVYLNDASVSRLHAKIAVDGRTATVEDLDSKNGTTLQGVRVAGRAAITDGDEVVFGNVRAQFVVDTRDDPTTITL
jgi:DNA-binding winged helix-turn-helix (wHTH) protein